MGRRVTHWLGSGELEVVGRKSSNQSGCKNVRILSNLFSLPVASISLTWVLAVYRVVWLRGKARYTRWKEEHIKVRDEMGNTLQFYRKRSTEWDERAKSSDLEGKLGHACYARLQAHIWKSLAEGAEKVFGKNAK